MSWLRASSMLDDQSQVTEVTVLPSLASEIIKVQANGKPLIVYFFAPWCQICHMSIGNLQNTYDSNKDNIDVIAIALDYAERNEVDNFVARHQLTFPVLLGTEQVKQRFQITGYPSYYVLDEENTIQGKSLGYSTELGLYLRSL